MHLQPILGAITAGPPRTMASWGCLPQQGSNTRTMNPAQSQALLPARPAHASRRAGRQGTVQTSAQSVRPQVRGQLKRRDCAMCAPVTPGKPVSARRNASVGHVHSPVRCAQVTTAARTRVLLQARAVAAPPQEQLQQAEKPVVKTNGADVEGPIILNGQVGNCNKPLHRAVLLLKCLLGRSTSC